MTISKQYYYLLKTIPKFKIISTSIGTSKRLQVFNAGIVMLLHKGISDLVLSTKDLLYDMLLSAVAVPHKSKKGFG